jgi:hypothetical protein
MPEKTARVVVFFYNRLFDPLIQGNFLVFVESYLKQEPGRYRFHLVTYENAQLPLTPAQQTTVAEMKRQGLEWTPLQWHPGTGIFNKLADIAAGFWAVLKLRSKGYRHLIAYNSVAGSFCYLYAKLFRLRLFLYTYEPHSEYSADNGMLSIECMQYRALNSLERKAAFYAAVISSGTRFMQQRLERDWKVPGRFFKIPSVTDCRKFAFTPEVREAVRSELGIAPETRVLFYPGKFGSLYYGVEIAWMYRWLLDEEPALHFLVVTQQPEAEITAMFTQAGVPRVSYSIRKSDYHEVQRFFFAADFGIIAVPAGPSKKFISNIKVGEYLCSGLPFLITRGVSEDYLVAEERGVGVVVDDFAETDIRLAWPAIRAFLEMDPKKRRAICVEVGRTYRGFESLNPVFRAAMEELICDLPALDSSL